MQKYLGYMYKHIGMVRERCSVGVKRAVRLELPVTLVLTLALLLTSWLKK